MSKDEHDDAVGMPKDGVDETLPSEQASQVEEQVTHVTEASSDMVPADGETEIMDPGLPANFPTNVPVDVPVSVPVGDLPETAVIPALGAATIAGDAEPGGSRRVSRGLVAGVTAGVLVLAAGGATTWGVLDHRSWNDEVSAYEAQVSEADDQVASSLVAASDAYDVAAADLAEAVTDGEEVLAATEGQVTDNAVREDLRSALDAAIALTDEEGADSYLTEDLVVPAISRSSLFVHDEREAYTVAITTSPAQLGEAGAEISTAVEAVAASHLEWARTQLTDAMTTGEEVLAASEGKVDDNAVREGLRSALDAAAPVRDAEDSGAQALLAARDAVNAATTAVADAHSAWQAEQDRIAAEKAAAERAAAQKAAQSSSGSSGNKGTSSGGKGTSSGSSGSGAGSTSKPSTSGSSGSSSGSSSGGSSGSVGCGLACGGNPSTADNSDTALVAWGCGTADTITYRYSKGWTVASAKADAIARGCAGPLVTY